MDTFSQFLRRKLPARREALLVFSLAVFLVYSWTIFRLFYELPSWLFYLGIGKILVLVAYALSFALLESALLFAFACLYSLLLPVRVFRAQFIAQGSLLVGLVSLAAVTAQRNLGKIPQLQSWEVIVYPLAAVLMLIPILLLSTWVFERLNPLPLLLQSLAERISVFSYLYLPLGLLSLALVVIRNLL